MDLFLDSGGYSAWTKGFDIDLPTYVQFIKDYEDKIETYANLDVIGDGEASYQNWLAMRELGVDPIPVYHPPTDIKYLKKYLKECDHIAIGGIATISKRERIIQLDRIWSRYLVDSRGYPKVKVHGFGLTSLDVLVRYPWYSVDSTTWLKQGVFGKIIIPRTVRGKFVFDKTPLVIGVSGRLGFDRMHIDGMPKDDRAKVLEYIHSKDHKLGLSEFFSVSSDYKLGENEAFTGEVYRTGNSRVERVVEVGICNSVYLRIEFGVIFFLDFEKNCPEWPWSFKTKKSLGVVV